MVRRAYDDLTRFTEADIKRTDLPRDAFLLIHDLCYHHDGRNVYTYVRAAQEILRKSNGEAGDRLKEIRERERKATKGPWNDSGRYINGDGHVLFQHSDVGCTLPDERFEEDGHNGDFVAHARTDIPWLLEQVESLQAELLEWKELQNQAHDAAVEAEAKVKRLTEEREEAKYGES